MNYATLFLSVLMLADFAVFGQSYIDPREEFKVAYVFSEMAHVQVLDAGSDYLYFSTGDTIYQADPSRQELSNQYTLPADYELLTFPSFLCLSPDESTLWAGYTDLENVDARIYSIETGSGAWNLEARMASNFDLAFWNDSVLVSGLNSADFNSPNGIYVLDTSGADQHRLIVECGGSSAGLAVDSHGNLYYGTSFLMDQNGLYRWDSAQVAAVVDSPGTGPLQLSDAVKLSDLHHGAYDCEVDGGDHLVFNINTWGGTQVIGSWNNNPGDGFNYDTLATSSQWLGLLKSRGDYTVSIPGNSLFTLGFDQAMADLHTCDYPPVQIAPLPPISGFESETILPIDLYQYVKDPDDHRGFDYIMTYLSKPSVASVTIDGAMLTGAFGSHGQTNLVLVATSAGKNVRLETVIGTWPRAEEGLLHSDFGELSLDPESFWNGSDGSGHFISGPARFHNSYNSEFESWSGWAYSNTSDVSTPGFANQYSAATGGGFQGSDPLNQVYGVSSLYGPSVIDFIGEKAHVVGGFYTTNSTYAALSMREGDLFAKKFGGDSGSDPDYFKLLVWGKLNGATTDTLEYYLADYRYENANDDYIISTWQWVDLSSLGRVDSLLFGLESSDTGSYGINTPAYFCLDNLMVAPDNSSSVDEYPESGVLIYPNPSGGQFIVESEEGGILEVSVYSMNGSLVYSNRKFDSGRTIDLGGLASSSYIVRIKNHKGVNNKLILIK